jgi:sulfur relay (sulfurtransferase) complex TusBCD TusD component (DsrE family)
MNILYVVSTNSMETIETIYYLSRESLSRGHIITIFFNSDSTHLLNSSNDSPFFISLLDLDVRLLACRTSVLDRELASDQQLIEKTEMSSLGELVSLMEEADRTVFLG